MSLMNETVCKRANARKSKMKKEMGRLILVIIPYKLNIFATNSSLAYRSMSDFLFCWRYLWRVGFWEDYH